MFVSFKIQSNYEFELLNMYYKYKKKKKMDNKMSNFKSFSFYT